MKAGPRENASFQCMECRHRMECSRLPALADQDTERHLPLLIWREADFPALPCSCPADLFSNQGAVTQTHFLHSILVTGTLPFLSTPDTLLIHSKQEISLTTAHSYHHQGHTFPSWRLEVCLCQSRLSVQVSVSPLCHRCAGVSRSSGERARSVSQWRGRQQCVTV